MAKNPNQIILENLVISVPTHNYVPPPSPIEGQAQRTQPEQKKISSKK